MVKILSSKNYKDTSKDYGDCIIFSEGKTAIIYDCGSEEHANRVISLLDEHGIDKATVVLSHNDDDHFKGIPYLIEKNRVDKLFTILLLKYTDEIIGEIGDGRRNPDSIKRAFKELYDNIASLENTVSLRDVYENAGEFPAGLKRIGPEFQYMIKAAAKALDGREGDTIDGESVKNAASVQVLLSFGNKKLLLTGDCAPTAIPEDVELHTFTHIQLPHHGKPKLAEEIFERSDSNNHITYIVSDNKGNSNGGSQDLNYRGHKVENTKNGDILISRDTANTVYTGRKLGI